MATRFFVEGRHESGDEVALDGSDARKIVTVLRMRDGEQIEVIDSAAQRFTARLAIDGRNVLARLERHIASSHAALPHITIAQGVPKGQKMDFVVEKLCELGVAQIIPLQSERTVVTDVSPNKIERWRRLAKTAAQQSGRSDILDVAQPEHLTALVDRFAQYDLVLFPWELANGAPLRETLPGLLANARRVLAVIGPEGGFSHAEAAAAQQAGAHLVSLGSRILRTESAALVLVSILNYVAGT